MLARRLALTLVSAVMLDACAQHPERTGTDAYVENGVLWAYGSVQMTYLEAPGSVMVKRLASDQSIDTRQTSRAYSLYGAYNAGGPSGERDIAYVDLHPSSDRFLAYSYQIDFTPRYGNSQHIDVWAVLKKAGRSYHGRHQVYLGAALFQDGGVFASLQLAEGMKLSTIADGVFSGQWALHYPDAPMVVVKPWSVTCDKAVSQMPGQNPSQNPGQFDQCRPLPSQHDLCSGDPTKCRPKPPVKPLDPVTPVQEKPSVVLDNGLEVVDAAERVYAMPAELKEVKITFSSSRIAAASDEENAAACAKRFLAVGRTVDRQVNTSCILKPAPASPRDGKLTCAVTLSFDSPETYVEKVCDVAAVFRGEGGETERLQILKR